MRKIAERDGFEVGVGGFFGLHSFRSSLDPFYGRSPVSIGVFVQVRPPR